MGEYHDAVESGCEDLAPLSHLRLLVLMALVAVAGSVYGFWRVSTVFGFGVLVGGALAFANYYWMKHSLRTTFEETAGEEKARFIGSKYVLRYFAFGTLLFALYLVHAELIVPLILGLSSFAAAVVLEGVFRIFGTFIK